jgi:hypothetical protein
MCYNISVGSGPVAVSGVSDRNISQSCQQFAINEMRIGKAQKLRGAARAEFLLRSPTSGLTLLLSISFVCVTDTIN